MSKQALNPQLGAMNVVAAWPVAGVSQRLGQAQNLQICTNFQASHCPALAKPPVI